MSVPERAGRANRFRLSVLSPIPMNPYPAMGLSDPVSINPHRSGIWRWRHNLIVRRGWRVSGYYDRSRRIAVVGGALLGLLLINRAADECATDRSNSAADDGSADGIPVGIMSDNRTHAGTGGSADQCSVAGIGSATGHAKTNRAQRCRNE